MDAKTFSLVAGVIFAVVALFHLVRIVMDWSVIIGDWSMPTWVSWVADFLLGLIARRPDLTLDEAVLAMHRHKIPGSRSAVWRFFKRHNVTFKKKPARGGAGARGRGASAPALDARTGHV